MVKFEQTFKAVDLILITSGIPSCSSFYPASIKSALKRNAVFLIAFTLLLYTAFGELVYLVQMLQREFTFLEITFQAPCLGYCSIGLMKMLILAMKRNSIAGLVQTLQKYWYTSVRSIEHQSICDEVMKPAIRFTTIVAVVNIVMGMAFTLLPIPEMIYHYTITGQWVRQLPFLIWWSFDVYAGFVYYFIYPLYIVIGFSGIIIHMGFDCLFCILAAHICVHFRILKHDLGNLTDLLDGTENIIENRKKVNPKLFGIVEKHQIIEECHNRMNTIFNFALFYNFFVSSFIICIQGFMVTAASGYTLIKFALFLASFLVELFLLCFYGHHIVESSILAAEAAYHCSWYNTNHQFRTIVLQMINKGQNPLTLMAWKIWPVDMSTFASILSASWSYFTLLRTVYAD
nr:odorant receptor 4-like [Aedes albopictus]